MVQVRIVRMGMAQSRMPVAMGVRFAGRIARPVNVLMVRVVAVRMLVRQR